MKCHSSIAASVWWYAVQKDMLSRARKEFDSCIKTVTSWDDFVPALDEKKMVLTPW